MAPGSTYMNLGEHCERVKWNRLNGLKWMELHNVAVHVETCARVADPGL